jgi:hypothetical protein
MILVLILILLIVGVIFLIRYLNTEKDTYKGYDSRSYNHRNNTEYF